MKKKTTTTPPTTPVNVEEGQHTPGEIWIESHNNPEYLDIESNYARLCSVYIGESDGSTDPNGKANAARIVECWNGYDNLKNKSDYYEDECFSLKAENEKLKEEAKKNQSEWAEMIVDLDCRSKEIVALKEAKLDLLEVLVRLVGRVKIYGAFADTDDYNGRSLQEAVKAIAKHK